MFKVISSQAATVAVLVCLIGSASISTASTKNGTLTVGEANASICEGPNHLPIPFYGYDEALSAGSYSSTGLTEGEAVIYLGDQIPFASCTEGIAFSAIAISGFSSNPGGSWLSSVECNGVTNKESSADQFSYSDGTAWWYWSTLFGLKSEEGSSVSCTIVHD